ncbi:MAG TPA: 4Fe-4S dicluster domain-containing protein [Methylomirabilota bacterium]|nr:4Fe-4S dicluster domain-containing protein [Methylomirabilota bacterium]
MPENLVLAREHLQGLFNALKTRDYQVLGPTVRDGAIVYDELNSVEELPIGWTDEQQGGSYRLKKRNDRACFGYVVGPHSWKRFLHPPAVRLWQAARNGKGFQILEEKPAKKKMAFVGVRACELHAVAIQDRVFLGDSAIDSHYQARRDGIFVLAVNCGQAGNTCFCASMGAGPKVESGFDLALTEILEGGEHYFVAEIGTELGREILKGIPQAAASAAQVEKAKAIHAATANQMGRSLDTVGIKELLYANLEHPRWDEVATRCLTCANCTMVCPTCFCSTVEDVTDLTGEHAERWRKWDSCFTNDFSYIHGGSVRATAKSRYRQWMTHKLATWIDQFGSSGCVGCGRCITWCPVGIDITEEVRAIRGTASPAGAGDSGKEQHGADA